MWVMMSKEYDDPQTVVIQDKGKEFQRLKRVKE